MTTPIQVPYVPYAGNGVSTIFTYPFYLLDAAHLRVYINGALLSPAFYTVASVGNPAGGEVTLATAPILGESVILTRVVPADQLVDYQPYDAFPAETHEKALDKLTMLVQQANQGLDKAIRAPDLEAPGTANLVLPAASVRANFVVGFDAGGNVVMVPPGGGGGGGVTDHSLLTNLSANDHPQYRLVADADAIYLPKSGGTMTGALMLIAGAPTLPQQAAPKSYVDTFAGSVLTKNVVASAAADGQANVETGWNVQANALGITRASNEIIYYRWPSVGTVVYRYVGSQQGPAGWVSVAVEWVAASGVAEAPLDGQVYGRFNANWALVVPKTGGAYTGKVQGFAGAAAAADLARTDEAMALDAAAIAAHNALLNPHPQYALLTDLTGIEISDTVPAPIPGEGGQWFESDQGSLYMRYQNPDATFTWILLNGATGGLYVPLAEKAAANGVASLDALGKVPVAQLPTPVATGMTMETKPAVGTSVDFTIPAGVKFIVASWANVGNNGVGASLMHLRLGDAGGIETAGYAGSYCQMTSVIAVTQMPSTGFVLTGMDTYFTSGQATLALVDAATNTWSESHVLGLNNLATVLWGAGHKALSQPLTTVRFTMVNGTDAFDAGTFSVMYQ